MLILLTNFDADYPLQTFFAVFPSLFRRFITPTNTYRFPSSMDRLIFVLIESEFSIKLKFVQLIEIETGSQTYWKRSFLYQVSLFVW